MIGQEIGHILAKVADEQGYVVHKSHMSSQGFSKAKTTGEPYGERERAKSAELSSGFRLEVELEFGLKSSFSQRGKHWSRLQLHDRQGFINTKPCRPGRRKTWPRTRGEEYTKVRRTRSPANHSSRLQLYTWHMEVMLNMVVLNHSTMG